MSEQLAHERNQGLVTDMLEEFAEQLFRLPPGTFPDLDRILPPRPGATQPQGHGASPPERRSGERDRPY